MDRFFHDQETLNSTELTRQVEELLPTARVHNLGYAVMTLHASGAISTIFPLTNSTADFTAKDAENKNYDLHDLSYEQVFELLRTLDGGIITNEETATANVAPVQATGSFYNDVRGNNGWWKDDEPYPKGHISRSLAENTDTPAIAPQVPQEMFSYLEQLLDAAVHLDASNIVVSVGCLNVTISPSEDRWHVVAEVNGELVLNADMAGSDLMNWVFQIVNQANERIAQFTPEEDATTQVVTNGEFYQELREMAEEAGAPTDIIRNKSLTDLRAGLVMAKPPFSSNTTDAWQTVKRAFPSASLRGATSYDGHPVSLNESRDISRPYADTLGGKVLRWIPGRGAVLLNKTDLPNTDRFLSNSAEGVLLVEGKENVQYKRPQWRGWGR